MTALIERVRGCPVTSRYPSVSVDRRGSYYTRVSQHITADPLDFYARAERGRRWQFRAFQAASDYERDAINDAEPVDPDYMN